MMKKLLVLAAAGSLMATGAAFAGKAPAPTQTNPVGSVVTPATTAAAISNATDASVTVTGVTDSGAAQVTVTATVGGSVVSVPAVAALSGGTVTVTFADGSSLSFNAADFS